MRTVGPRGALVIGAGVAVVAVAGLALAEALHVSLLVDPADHMTGRGSGAATGVGLLVADIVMPVPSSVVMVAHGSLFGVLPGAALSVVGRTGNAVVGVLLGRGAGNLLCQRGVPDASRGAALIERWGLAAVVLTRPVPVLAESTLVAAGATGLAPGAVVAAAVVGALPEAVLYAAAGHLVASEASAAIVFVAVLVLAAGAWAVGTGIEKSNRRPDTAADAESARQPQPPSR